MFAIIAMTIPIADHKDGQIPLAIIAPLNGMKAATDIHEVLTSLPQELQRRMATGPALNFPHKLIAGCLQYGHVFMVVVIIASLISSFRAILA